MLLSTEFVGLSEFPAVHCDMRSLAAFGCAASTPIASWARSRGYELASY